MKKRLFLIPLLMIGLVSCDPISSSSDTSSSESSSPSSGDTSSITPTKELDSIEVLHAPNKTEYKVGELFSSTGLVVQANYKNDVPSEIVTDYVLSIQNNYKFVTEDIGEQLVTVLYQTEITTFGITVTEATLEAISIKTEPTKTSYDVGQTFSINGLVVEAIYSDESRTVLTNYTCSVLPGTVFTTDDIGIKEITVTYEGKFTSFFIHIYGDEPSGELESISVTHMPNKVDYKVGEAFSLNGLEITAHYSDDEERVIDEYTTSISHGHIFDDSEVGSEVTVYVSHNDDPLINTSFNISVSEVTIEEKCDELNALLASYDEFDAFDARDYLVSSGFTNLVEPQANDDFFGYDEEAKEIVIYNMDVNSRSIRYPSDRYSHHVVSYQTKNVGSYNELVNELATVSGRSKNYSVLTLSGGIEITSQNPIGITFGTPVQIDLNNYSISASTDKDIFVINHDNARVSIVNGSISTYNNDEEANLGEQISPKCINVTSLSTLDVRNVNLHSNARYGYGIIDNLNASALGTIRLKDSTNSTARSNLISVQKANYVINNCTIAGVVNVSGGRIAVKDSIISANGKRNGATSLVENSYIADIATYLYLNNASKYGYYDISSTDPIIIFDNKSIYGEYSNPIVVINNTTLEADSIDNNPIGYGIRYIDMNLDTTKSSKATIYLEDIYYVNCSSQEAPENLPGGYSRYTVS